MNDSQDSVSKFEQFNKLSAMMVRSNELIRVWKHDPYSEAICHEFVDNMRLVSSYARQEDVPMIVGAATKMVDYIRESVRENVLGDRVFFLGVEKQSHALSTYINEQLIKNQGRAQAPMRPPQAQQTIQAQPPAQPTAASRVQPPIAPPPVQSRAPQPAPAPTVQHTPPAPVVPVSQPPVAPPITPNVMPPEMPPVPEAPIELRHDYDMPTIATQDVQSRFVDAIPAPTVETIEPIPGPMSVDEYALDSELAQPSTSMLSQPIEENYETLGVLIVELFGVPYALPSDEVLLVLEEGMGECTLIDGQVRFVHQNRDYQYTMLSHVLFQEPLIAPTDHHKLVLLKSNNQIICVCVDSVVGFEIIDMKSVIEAPPESYFSGAGFNDYIASVNVLDIHHMIAFVNSQHELSDVDAAIFNASNKHALNAPSAAPQPTVPTLSAAAESPLVNYSEGAPVSVPPIDSGIHVETVLELDEPEEVQVVAPHQSHGVVSFGSTSTQSRTTSVKPRVTVSSRPGSTSPPEVKKVSLSEDHQGIETLFLNTAQDVFSHFQKFVTKSEQAPDWRLSLIQGNLSTVDILDAYDVVVLDSKQGDTVNMDMLTFIRGDLRYRRFPVIVSTHLSSDVFKQRAYLLGANYVLKKPYTHEQLLEVIKLVASQVTVVEDIYDEDNADKPS